MTKTKNLSFELITDPEIIRFTHLMNGQNWSGKLTVEQYADREWHIGCESKIGKRDVQNNLGLHHFVLRDLDLPNDTKTSNIVASCETMNRSAWRIDPQGELKEVVAPCVGGVYTIPEYRGKGYAGEMITRLNEYWDSRLDKNGFMTLYSEVGNYYQRFGYQSLEIPLHEVKISSDYTPLIDESKFHFLKYEEYGKIVEHQKKIVKESLVKKSKTEKKHLFSLTPDLDIYSWFHDRDLFISSRVHPELKIEHFGVMANDGSLDHIIWLHDWNDHHLTILQVSASTPERFEELFNCAAKEAQRFDMHEIALWDNSLGPDHDSALKFIQTFEGSKTFQPNGSVSAIRALDGSDASQYLWEFNEKWCWF